MADGETALDLLVVGGGINGAGIACDAAGRGLSVALVEQDDLAAATSSASSKLIHGGLRYLEQFEFRLVREALAEREVLLGKAPHIIRPLRFVLPRRRDMRPAWMLRLGLFLYDHLARRDRLPGSCGLDLGRDPAGAPLKPEFRRGFAYYDCRVDDARLVVLNAMQAAEKGARVLTRHRLVRARRSDGVWRAEVEDRRTNATLTLAARALVNAAGPWVDHVLSDVLGLAVGRHVRLVKGSHIVVPKLHDGDDAYILQHRDGRVTFVLPYEGGYSLIGTTDLGFDGDPAGVAPSAEEVAYLVEAVHHYFRAPVDLTDVVWSYAGVRPLYDDREADLSAVTRDYVLDLDGDRARPPALSVFGGKITTYRRLAEEALELLAPFFPGLGPAWTAGSTLPGGDLPVGGLDALVAALAGSYPRLPADYLSALARRHGTLAGAVLADARTEADLGRDFGAGLRAREIDYMRSNEWAKTAADVLWRRSKCGLHMAPEARAAVEAYLAGGAATPG